MSAAYAAMSLGEQRAAKNKAKVAFDAYAGGGTIDGSQVADAIRCLDLNPTIALVNSLGGTDDPGEVYYTFEEFFKIYLACKDDKNAGGFYDFVEILKIYDTKENGLMKLVELTHMLLNLGERITDEELDEVLNDCMKEEEDDDGFFPYLPFLCRLCDKPVPKSWIPE